MKVTSNPIKISREFVQAARERIHDNPDPDAGFWTVGVELEVVWKGRVNRGRTVDVECVTLEDGRKRSTIFFRCGRVYLTRLRRQWQGWGFPLSEFTPREAILVGFTAIMESSFPRERKEAA